MLLVHYVCTTSFEVLYLFTVGGLQRTKHTYITRLKFVRHMRRKATHNDVVLKAERKHVERFMRSETVVDQDLRLAIRALLCGGVEYFLHPFQVDG
jgi:hypothetical protein